jgi:hypothetical protein
MARESVEKFVSLSELSRLANVTGARIVALHDSGVIKCDARSGNSILFRADRLDELKAAIHDCGLNRAIKANTARQHKS